MNQTIFYSAVFLLSIWVFVFVLWKNLKDDYIPSQIFSLAFWLILFGLGATFAGRFVEDWDFWIIVCVLFLCYLVVSKKLGIKFFEGLDSLILSICIFLVVNLSFYLFRDANIFFPYFAFFVLLLLVYFLVKNQYKRFLWYKSGRRGFTSLFLIGLTFLSRAFAALFFPDKVFGLIEYDPIFSGLISFVAFLNIFILAKI